MEVILTASNKLMAGKVCLITGGTSGIGEATARALARLGGTVVITARNEVNLRLDRLGGRRRRHEDESGQ